MQGLLALLLVASSTVSIVGGDAEQLSVAAFNIQVFGKSKMSKTVVPEVRSKPV
jgi:hypothetical protein